MYGSTSASSKPVTPTSKPTSPSSLQASSRLTSTPAQQPTPTLTLQPTPQPTLTPTPPLQEIELINSKRKQLKKEILHWEKDYVNSHGSAPTATDKVSYRCSYRCSFGVYDDDDGDDDDYTHTTAILLPPLLPLLLQLSLL